MNLEELRRELKRMESRYENIRFELEIAEEEHMSDVIESLEYKIHRRENLIEYEISRIS